MLIDELELDYYDFVISCLDSHSDGTPIHCRESIGNQVV